jgi:murein DD-endopeptidase MepM/ murein hydrolase activator NlpD
MTPPRERVHVVVERTDGSRIVRLPAPRWLVSVGVALVGLVLVSAGALYRDYVALATQRAEFAALQSRLAEQQLLIDGFHERVGQMRSEIDGWRELRARIWEPLGPGTDVPAVATDKPGPGKPAGDKPAPGMGGATAMRLAEPQPPSVSLLDDLERLATVVTEEGESLRALERYLSRAGKVLASLPSRWPLRGPVNSDFGRRPSPWSDGAGEFHSGLDIGAARGTSVTAPAPGTVVFAGWHAEYGVTVVVDHGNDIKTLYGHLSKALVAADQKVQRGQVLALTGNTGRSSGPHLHYEIQVAGQAVNPRGYLWD